MLPVSFYHTNRPGYPDLCSLHGSIEIVTRNLSDNKDLIMMRDVARNLYILILRSNSDISTSDIAFRTVRLILVNIPGRLLLLHSK